MADVVSATLPTRRVYVSHLARDELDALGRRFPDYEFRPRIGTALWLGRPRGAAGALHVLDVHDRCSAATCSATAAARCRGPATSWSSPAAPRTASASRPRPVRPRLKDRAVRVARGGLDAAGLARSPFTVGGKQRLFAEPPHMQASMLFLPHGAPVPGGRRRGRRARPLHHHDLRRDPGLLPDRSPDRSSRAARGERSERGGSIGSSVTPSERTGSRHGRRMSRTTTPASHSSAATRTTIATQ